MKTSWMPTIVLFCASAAPAEDGIPWRENYPEAVISAAATGKLIMMDFTAAW